jgi:molybdenum cofactor cytidylyltransferase
VINAIILAAGESTRMGMPKPLLRFPGSMGVPPVSTTGILPLNFSMTTNRGPIPDAGAFWAGSVTLSNQQSCQGQENGNVHGRDGRATGTPSAIHRVWEPIHGRDAHATENTDATFLEQIVSVLRQADVDRLTVVLGAQAQMIRAATDLSGVDVVVNEDYRQGQLSSLVVGLKSLPAGTEAILLCLVDNPFITTKTVNGVVGAFRVSGRPIVVPVFEGRRGHPALFARPMFQELLHAPADRGARHVLHAHEDRVFEVKVADPGILARIDTPQDYFSHFELAPAIIER